MEINLIWTTLQEWLVLLVQEKHSPDPANLDSVVINN